ncbi:MAG TPA: histidine phosphatase family protein [Micromonospora sp.]
MAEIVLVRHGQTEWSAAGRHTSYTDLGLTADGERQARALAERLAGRRFVAVLCSPRIRARHTAQLAGLTVTELDEDLVEWNYGRYEGLTTVEIRRDRPGWWVWSDGCPDGESPPEVAARMDRVLGRVAPLLEQGDVALVGHAHSLRMAGARWVGLEPAGGGLLRLDTGTLSTLGHERERPVVLSWNAP